MNTIICMLLDKIIEDLKINCVSYSAVGKIDIIYDSLEIHCKKPFTAWEKLELILDKLKISKKEEAYEKTD